MVCHALKGDRNGASISEYTREKGDRDAQGTETLFSLGVFIGQLELYLLPLLQNVLRKVYGGEGGNSLLWISGCPPQPFHEWCHNWVIPTVSDFSESWATLCKATGMGLPSAVAPCREGIRTSRVLRPSPSLGCP